MVHSEQTRNKSLKVGCHNHSLKFNRPTPIPLINLFYDNSLISCYNSHKYLSITFDKLNFKTHIDKITSKISRSVGILSKLHYIFPTSSLIVLYHSLVHSHLLFGLTSGFTVWGSIFSFLLSQITEASKQSH